MKRHRLFAVVGALLLSASASAAQIEYVQTGFGFGTIGNINFGTAAPSPFTIRATGDTANIQSCGAGCLFNDNLSASIEIESRGTFQFLTPTRFFSVGNTIGFAHAGSVGLDLYDMDVGSTWDMATSFGPVVGTGELLQWAVFPVLTSGGTLVVRDYRPLATFKATVSDASVVPVPGSLLLLGSSLAGLLAIGRRRKATAA